MEFAFGRSDPHCSIVVALEGSDSVAGQAILLGVVCKVSVVVAADAEIGGDPDRAFFVLT